MKHIVLFGAGKSATCLIDYLLHEILLNNWALTVCDSNLALVKSKIGHSKNVHAFAIFVENDQERNHLIESADIVISLLPPGLHFIVAKSCIAYNKNLLTASYADANIRSLAKEIEDKRLFFLCEMGLDPGIDHMSAMKIIHKIKRNAGKITSFMSHCGGLISPESDDNPWHYKITWNSRNIVLAGKDGATYLKESQVVSVPYRKIFAKCPGVNIPGSAPLAWYPNRDSLQYIPVYALHGISTFIRTTLRHPSFCRGWQKFAGADCTSTQDIDQIKECKTFKEWFDVKAGVIPAAQDTADPYGSEFAKQLNYFGYNTNDPLPTAFTCSADILQAVMENRLAMQQDDKDRIVMLHEIEYEQANASTNQTKKVLRSCLIIKGENNVRTAMAKAVGLPLGISAKLILQGKINLTGLHIPIVPEIYEPVLSELEEHQIIFNETE